MNGEILTINNEAELGLSVEPDKNQELPNRSASRNMIAQNDEMRNYSMAEMDDQYAAAVKSGDMDRAQWMVNMAAEKAGYTETVYHGTESFGFTKFDMDRSQNEIFVSYNPNLAKTYTSILSKQPKWDYLPIVLHLQIDRLQFP